MTGIVCCCWAEARLETKVGREGGREGGVWNVQ